MAHQFPVTGSVESTPEWTKVLVWAETAGLENLKARNETLATLRKEAAATLTIVLAGLAGSLAYAAKMFEPGPAGTVSFSAAAVCCWLVIVAARVVSEGMRTVDLPAIHNEPLNLAKERYTLDKLRFAELKNLQQRIDETALVIGRVASDLNEIRVMALATPVVFLVAAIIYTPGATPAPISAGALKMQCTAVAQAAASDPQLGCRLIP